VPYLVVTLCDVPTSSHIDCNSYYTDEELMALKFEAYKPSRLFEP
jgi:hypothetical protein